MLKYELTPAKNTLPAKFENFSWWDEKSLESSLENRVPLFHGSLPPESGMQARVVDALTAMLADQKVTATVVAMQHNDLLSGSATGIMFRVDKPSVQVGPVSFSGESAGWTPQLDGIAKATAGQDYGDDSTPKVLRDAVHHVYFNKGYLDAHASSVAHGTPVIEADKVLVPMSFTVVEGEQYRLGHFTLTGSVLMDQDEFIKKAKLKTGDVVEEDKLHRTMLSLSGPYVTRGYLHAKISATGL